ncbi:hypothetical protein OWR29_03500 [Actinoplanes sp. Pm04-4]|uniref:Uncharacterized protein n=1 Tax=Paractinoplanes pyxinae TaxID=2997416 RepID=A0ABT4AS17_9ACTN|nr:hypothetical protein [Actinoplanes pyxinae]MCY1137049.1 hypothetical protein [Actinoplanes pyxinae]
MRTEQRTSGRYGTPAEAAGYAGAFAALVVLAAVTLLGSAHIMSNSCIVGSEQSLCPIAGPDWSRPVPVTVILLGLLTGLLGLAAGRPIRRNAMIAAYAMVVLGLVITLLIG